MSIPKYNMGKQQGDFIAKPSTMEKKLVIIVPSDYRKDLQKVMGRRLKFHWEDVLDKRITRIRGLKG